MKYKQINNNSINQVMLIIIIILISILVFKNLIYYLPGFLGAITLYILFRGSYLKLTENTSVEQSANKHTLHFAFHRIYYPTAMGTD